ncbi:hypothetical protein PybrP1_008098 [[Pythium] brassicae (nom. inval.)]|nr:hypothetical protein PybrP1_008098 [[Pythium] brassicae (nom. inval.)]
MPKTKRWASSEHSRVVSGVFPRSIHGGDEEHEGSILQNAAFGLAQVKLQSMRNVVKASARNLLRPSKVGPQRDGRSSRAAASTPTDDSRRASQPPSRPRASSLTQMYDAIAKLRVATRSELLWLSFAFLDALYILVSVPLRLGFFFDPWNEPYRRSTWTLSLSLFSVLDAALCVARVAVSRKMLAQLVRSSLLAGLLQTLERTHRESSIFRIIRASVLGDDTTARSGRSAFSARGDRIAPFDAVPMRRRAKPPKLTLRATWFETLATLAYVLPWEGGCALLSFNWMHVVGVLRCPHAAFSLPARLHAILFTHLRETRLVQLLSFSTLAIAVYLFFVGVYLCHAAAAGYLFVAHWRCGLAFTHCDKFPLPQAWVLRDNLERASTLRKYVRSLYWACKTVTTLGQGDLVPTTNAETLYRIFVQLVSGLWATAILTAYSFYFSHKDANMATNICTRQQQATQFLLSRKLSKELAQDVRTYFQYMDRTRTGVEEDLILSNLPTHYRTQCSHYVKYKCFRRIAIFKNRRGAFLRTVLSLLEKDFFAPGQVVLRLRAPEEMLIVAAGEIRITDDANAVRGRLTAGNAYAEYALFEDHLAANRLVAETYCELWCLTRRSFKVALQKHFSKFMYASILAKKLGASKAAAAATAATAMRAPDDPPGVAARRNSFDDMEANAHMLKLVGAGSNVKNKMVQRLTKEAASAASKVAAWRQPDSAFQFAWARAKCALLLLLIAEVPHQVAFQRGFGLLNSAEHPVYGAVPVPVQVADFALSVAVELFFYADLYLRARCFVRPALSRREQQAEDEHSYVSAAALISAPAQIFRHFVENDSYWPDVVASLPLALAWDVLPKQWFAPRTVQCLRFVRALRLLRVRSLKQLLRTLLLDHGFAQYSRLLVYIVTGVVAAAHCAGCVFFLVADMDAFHGGLPVGGVAPRAIPTAECLERASLFGNCTWYMYDRSTFGIDAPYLRSLHWSLVLLSTVGYGDIVAFTTKECVAGCLWIFCGANICYFTGSALASVAAQVNILDSVHQDRVAEINLALASSDAVSAATKSAVRSYYETKWALNGSAVHDEDVMLHLPRSLRRQVMHSLFLDDVRRCPLFVDASPENDALLQMLAQSARCEIFLRNAFVIREGHLATEFFLIQSGDAEKLLPALKAVAVSLMKPPAGAGTRRSSVSSASSPQLMRLSAKLAAPVTAGVETAIAKFGAPFTLVKQSSRGLFKKSISSPNVVHIRLGGQAADGDSDDNDAGSGSRSGATLSAVGGPPLSSAPPAPGLTKASTPRASVATRQSLWRIGVRSAPHKRPDDTIFVSVLRKGDCFGEESLAPRAQSEVYQISVRVFSTIQAVVIRREDFMALSARFPQQFRHILARRAQQARADDDLLKKLRVNFFFKEKLKTWIGGSTDSLCLEEKRATGDKLRGALRSSLDPESAFAKWWHRAIGAVLVYNFYVVIFRVAFLPYPSPTTMAWLTAVDYGFDALLYVDIYLKHERLGLVEYGQTLRDPAVIRRRYRDGYFAQDCVSMLPLYYRGDYFYMSAARVVRLVRSPQLLTLLNAIHSKIQQRFLRGNTVLLNVFSLIKFALIFVSTAHYIGSLYYMLGRLQLETGLVATSWVNADFILAQHPHDPLVHYMRAMYWCLSTFTVDCFGDIWARNFLEVCFAGFTCVLGWIFIGQVIGRINTLIVTLNLEAKQRRERREDFQQYAKQRNIPPSLRQRAMQSLAYKSECRLALGVGDVFADLPHALRSQLFFEMYGAFLRDADIFQRLKRPQLEAVASALLLEIYLPGDLIFAAGRAGSRLDILKAGVAELFSPTTGVVFAALLPGTVFGEFSFFIPNATRLVSARAVRSCQVLQLERRRWNALWPREVRLEIEETLVPLMKAKYAHVARTYMNISKNLARKTDKADSAGAAVLRVPLPRPKRFSRRFLGSPTKAQHQGERAASPTTKARQHSASLPNNSVVKALSGPKAKSRRATVLGRRASELEQLRDELEAVQSFEERDSNVSARPPPRYPPSETLRLATATMDAPGDSVETDEPESGRQTRSSFLRGSSFPPPRRISSTSSDAVGRGVDRLQLQPAPSEPSRSRLESHEPRTQAEIAEIRVESVSSSDNEGNDLVCPMESGLDMLNRTVHHEPAAAPAAPSFPQTLGLSLASEARWKRHHKRLQGIMAFSAGSLAVAEVIGRDDTAPSARRHSVSVLPSREDAMGDRARVQQAWKGLNAYFPVRRHSVQGDPDELAAALLAMNEFEDKMTVEVVPISGPDLSERVRLNGVSSSSSRRFSALNHLPLPPAAAADDSPASRRGTWTHDASWWRALFVDRHSKVAPYAESAATAVVRPKQDPRFQIWVQRAPVAAVFQQHSAFRRCWDVVMLAVTLYYIVVIPFRIGFLHAFLSDPAHIVAVEAWFLLEYALADALCVLDMVFQRRYFVFLRHGEVVSDPAELAAHYWAKGSLVVDALSAAPFELLAAVGVFALTHPVGSRGAAAGGHPPPSLWPTLALFRINRFLRGVHLHALLDKVQRFLVYDVKVGAAWSRGLQLLRLALDFALGTHWVACFFYGVSFLAFDEQRPSWLTAPGMLLFAGCDSLAEVARVPVGVAYLRSLHFSIGAITTVCYGDILPMNAAENVATLVVIFLSVALFSMLSGGFFKLFEHELGKRAQYEERVAQIGRFMVFHQFPARTWKQMQVYFALSWQESKGMHEDEMLRGLTTTARREIALHVHANLIKHVRLFTHTDEHFARVVVAALKHELFVRNDVVIQRGDMGRSLYIIETGLISICVVRDLYDESSTVAASTAEHAEIHRSSVTEWMAQTTLTLAEAKRLAGGAAARSSRGRKVTQREEKFVKGPFDYFGERSLLFGTPRNATCVALCVCSLFVLTHDRFEEVMAEFPDYRTKCVRIWVMNKHLDK